jgi:hypothetical protein
VNWPRLFKKIIAEGRDVSEAVRRVGARDGESEMTMATKLTVNLERDEKKL